MILFIVVGCPTKPEAPSVTRLKYYGDSDTLIRFNEKAKLSCPPGLRLDNGGNLLILFELLMLINY